MELIPGVREALESARALDYLLFLHTNQSGVGRGWYGLEDVDACNQRMLELIDLPGFEFTEICIATEAPDDPPEYRKPSPRFIEEMMAKHGFARSQSYMVGDRDSDIGAGLNSGIKSVMVKTGHAFTDEVDAFIENYPVLVFDDLLGFLKSLG